MTRVPRCRARRPVIVGLCMSVCPSGVGIWRICDSIGAAISAPHSWSRCRPQQTALLGKLKYRYWRRLGRRFLRGAPPAPAAAVVWSRGALALSLATPSALPAGRLAAASARLTARADGAAAATAGCGHRRRRRPTSPPRPPPDQSQTTAKWAIHKILPCSVGEWWW